MFEREIAEYLRRCSRDARTYVDVGAGQGEYVLYFMARSAVERVVAFEPSVSESATLNRNIALNGMSTDGRLQIMQAMVGNKPPFEMLDDIGAHYPRAAAHRA